MGRWTRACWLAGALALVGTSCATYSDKTAEMRSHVDRAEYEKALKDLNRLMKVKSADELPTKSKSEVTLAILERGTLLQAMGDYERSARDMGVADKELEFLDIARDTAGNIGKYIYSDSATKYKTSPIEKLSINAINMVNYLARGDLDGARVEAKRFTVMRNYLRDFQPDHAHAAWGSYLAGFTMEKLGENDSAMQERELPSLREPIARLASRSSYRTDRLAEYAGVEAPPGGDPPAEILTIVKVGRVPYKVPERIPIGAAIGLASLYISGDPKVLEYSAFKFVNYPELAPSGTRLEDVALQVDGKTVSVDFVTDLAEEIVREYEEIKPRIIGAALSRMIVRAAAAEGARAAGNQAEEGGSAIGLLAAFAVEGTLVALDKPDTRSWTLLPAYVYMARTPVPAGAHQVQVWMRGNGLKEVRTIDVTVPEKGYLVLDVTPLR